MNIGGCSKVLGPTVPQSGARETKTRLPVSESQGNSGQNCSQRLDKVDPEEKYWAGWQGLSVPMSLQNIIPSILLGPGINKPYLCKTSWTLADSRFWQWASDLKSPTLHLPLSSPCNPLISPSHSSSPSLSVSPLCITQLPMTPSLS